MRRILLIMIGASMLLYSAFSRDGSGMITDSVTGLVWQDNETVQKTWVKAISYCEALTLGGNDDWRLPNKKELLSIVYYDTYNPAISSVFQKTTLYDDYWTSTTYVDNPTHAWRIHFESGGISDGLKSFNRGIRCVK